MPWDRTPARGRSGPTRGYFGAAFTRDGAGARRPRHRRLPDLGRASGCRAYGDRVVGGGARREVGQHPALRRPRAGRVQVLRHWPALGLGRLRAPSLRAARAAQCGVRWLVAAGGAGIARRRRPAARRARAGARRSRSGPTTSSTCRVVPIERARDGRVLRRQPGARVRRCADRLGSPKARARREMLGASSGSAARGPTCGSTCA